jgi:invasion protein IalB
MNLKSGLVFTIDNQEPLKLPFIANSSFATINMTKALLKRLQEGTTLVVQVTDQSGKAIAYSVPLASFAKAYAELDFK